LCFQPSIHAETFFAVSLQHPELYDFLPYGPFPSIESFLLFYSSRIQQHPGVILFAILDKTRSLNEPESALVETFAGVVGFLLSDPIHLKTEIGMITTFPAFQRTHVTSNAVGLLLHYTLDLPAQGGLGLRRVQWQTHELNAASVRVAMKLGFRKEGILRWDRVLPEGKTGNGREQREGDPKGACLGRDSVMLSMCWDDWITQRESVKQVMDRR
jgi:RimJ/RimL family protein N-acetyltransferase